MTEGAAFGLLKLNRKLNRNPDTTGGLSCGEPATRSFEQSSVLKSSEATLTLSGAPRQAVLAAPRRTSSSRPARPA